jgi:hypothetical protein
MPNWCNNTLQVIGPRKEVLRFMNDFKGQPTNWNNSLEEDVESEVKAAERPDGYCFNALLPVPEEVIKNGFSNNWGDDDIAGSIANPIKDETGIDGYH